MVGLDFTLQGPKMETRNSKIETGKSKLGRGDSYSGFTTPNALTVILSEAKNLPSPGAFNCSDSSLRCLEGQVIPAKAGIRFAKMDPRFRGGDDG